MVEKLRFWVRWAYNLNLTKKQSSSRVQEFGIMAIHYARGYLWVAFGVSILKQILHWIVVTVATLLGCR